jgi:hypothetical protein
MRPEARNLFLRQEREDVPTLSLAGRSEFAIRSGWIEENEHRILNFDPPSPNATSLGSARLISSPARGA